MSLDGIACSNSLPWNSAAFNSPTNTIRSYREAFHLRSQYQKDPKNDIDFINNVSTDCTSPAQEAPLTTLTQLE